MTVGILKADEKNTKKTKQGRRFWNEHFPLSELWLLNSERNPDRVLRNANDYFIPQPRIELVKRLSLFTFSASLQPQTTHRVANSASLLS